MGLLSAIQSDRGQPASVRIGVLTSTSPLTVNVQGTEFTDVGVLNGSVPPVGSTVALLGQSSVSSDGSSWLMLGTTAGSGGGGGSLAGQGYFFPFEEGFISWADNVLYNLPGMTFSAALTAGHLYDLKFTFLAQSNLGMPDSFEVILSQDAGVLLQVMAVTSPGSAKVFNTINIGIRPVADITSTFTIDVQQPNTANACSFTMPNGGYFAVFDLGVQSGVIDN